MGQEIEAKMKVDSHESIRSTIKMLDGQFVADIFELNIFFDDPAGSLCAGDVGLRVRHESHSGGPCAGHRIVMTYKGPRRHVNGVKSREELEMQVSDAETAASILEKLGYRRTLQFEKRRQRWRLDACSIELDQMPILGCYVEIEGPDHETVLKVRQSLGLEDAALLTDSYAAMLSAAIADRGLKPIVEFDT